MMEIFCVADTQWESALFQVMIWGGVAVAVIALLQLFRAMFEENKRGEEDAAGKSQNALIGFVALGCALAFGGYYLKTKIGPDAGNEFREFVSQEGKFKVKFPGSPSTQTKGGFLFTIKSFSVDSKDGSYGVAYVDLPNVGVGGATNTILDSACTGMLKAMGAKKKSEARISLDGKYPGREIHADIPDKVWEMYASFYIVNQRAYLVGVAGKSFWLKNENARKFLNSFALIN
jgi:hypothetical protein